MTDPAIIFAKAKLAGYGDSGKIAIELVNLLIKRYGISVYDLDVFEEHECDRD